MDYSKSITYISSFKFINKSVWDKHRGQNHLKINKLGEWIVQDHTAALSESTQLLERVQ